MNYEPTIETREHAAFCRAEAQRRYEGKLIRDEYGMRLVRDAKGAEHTDDVLRALSDYRSTPPSLYTCFVQRAGQPYVERRSTSCSANMKRRATASNSTRAPRPAERGSSCPTCSPRCARIGSHRSWPGLTAGDLGAVPAPGPRFR